MTGEEAMKRSHNEAKLTDWPIGRAKFPLSTRNWRAQPAALARELLN